jgi:hypothetical protein
MKLLLFALIGLTRHVPWLEDEAKATWALVAVGFFGTFAAIWTLWIIHKQTNALMDADHALVLVIWRAYAHLDPSKPNSLSHCLQWNIHNAGKSPAFVREINSRLIVINSLDELPTTPNYRKEPLKMTDKMEPVLPGKDSPGLFTSVESSDPYQTLESDFKNGKRLLYAYGFVRYLDMYRRKHETRFGLVYTSSGEDTWRLAGPEEYNRYT